MKKICCPSLWRALIEHRDGLEWTPVSEGDAAGPIVVFQWTGNPINDPTITCTDPGGWVPLMWCPYCGSPI